MESSNIRRKYNGISSSELTSDSVYEFENGVDEHLRSLERELAEELENKRTLANNIGIVQAQVSELWDRVDKARRRETDISYRVTAWAQHLSEQMSVVKAKKKKIWQTIDSSANLSNEIGQNLQKLVQKRDNVQRMREEIDVRRHLHKQQLRAVKEEMNEQQNQIRHWDAISKDISMALANLKTNRDGLLMKVELEMRQEAEQKKMLEDLESMLRSATTKNRSKKYENKSDSENYGRYVTSFSTLTDEST